MSEGNDVLPFPADDADEPALAAHVAALYTAFPARDPADAERCARAVIADAQRQRAAGRGWQLAVPRRRWWWGAAAAALLVAVTLRPWRPDATSSSADSALNSVRAVQEPQGSITPVDGGDAVRFDLKLPARATAVALVGDFNGWDDRATPMLRRNGDGTWSARVELPPGRHVYAFVVDGQRWLVDPLAPQVPDAGFGPANALIVGETN